MRHVRVGRRDVSVLAVILYGLFRGGWLDALLAGIALGMSMLPEEFPVVLTVFMAMGAWRISRARVLTRRASAIETLGSATVLCTDKTGTLTENRMSIAALRLKDGSVFPDRNGIQPRKVPDAFHDLLRFGILASAPEPFDPMEKAFHELGARVWPSRGMTASARTCARVRPAARTVGDYPGLAGRRKDGFLVCAAKGAPEAIAGAVRFFTRRIAALELAADAMAAEGLRVLGVARAQFAGENLPENPARIRF